MLEIIFVFLMALVCPKHHNTTTTGNGGTVTTQDTGGETGHVPPKPPAGGIG